MISLFTPHRPSNRPTNLSNPPKSASSHLYLYPALDPPTHLPHLDLSGVVSPPRPLGLKQLALDRGLQPSLGIGGTKPQLELELCPDRSADNVSLIVTMRFQGDNIQCPRDRWRISELRQTLSNSEAGRLDEIGVLRELRRGRNGWNRSWSIVSTLERQLLILSLPFDCSTHLRWRLAAEPRDSPPRV